ncbi:MAG: hypothetical protein ACRYFR_14315 [Janthinobacterium lividum]
MTRAIIFYVASTLMVFFYIVAEPFVWLTGYFMDIAQRYEDRD